MATDQGLDVQLPEKLSTTIAACHTIIRQFYAVIKQQNTIIQALDTRQIKLSQAVEALRSQVGLNSTNSSKPPSSNFKNKHKQKKRRGSSRSNRPL